MSFYKLLNTAAPWLIKSHFNLCWDILCVKERQGVGQSSSVSAQPPGEQEEGVTNPCCSLASRKSSHTGRRLVFLFESPDKSMIDTSMPAGTTHEATSDVYVICFHMTAFLSPAVLYFLLRSNWQTSHFDHTTIPNHDDVEIGVPAHASWQLSYYIIIYPVL